MRAFSDLQIRPEANLPWRVLLLRRWCVLLLRRLLLRRLLLRCILWRWLWRITIWCWTVTRRRTIRTAAITTTISWAAISWATIITRRRSTITTAIRAAIAIIVVIVIPFLLHFFHPVSWIPFIIWITVWNPHTFPVIIVPEERITACSSHH